MNGTPGQNQALKRPNQTETRPKVQRTRRQRQPQTTLRYAACKHARTTEWHILEEGAARAGPRCMAKAVEVSFASTQPCAPRGHCRRSISLSPCWHSGAGPAHGAPHPPPRPRPPLLCFVPLPLYPISAPSSSPRVPIRAPSPCKTRRADPPPAPPRIPCRGPRGMPAPRGRRAAIRP